jgi:hypothetical protein
MAALAGKAVQMVVAEGMAYLLGTALAGSALERFFTHEYDTPITPPPEAKMTDVKDVDVSRPQLEEKKNPIVPPPQPAEGNGYRVINGVRRQIPLPPSYRDANNVFQILNKQAETNEWVRRMAGMAPIYQEAMTDAGLAMGQVFTPNSFASMLADRGIPVRNFDRVIRRIVDQFGDTANAQAFIKRWLVNKILPVAKKALITAAGTAVANEVIQSGMSLFREFNEGEYDETEEDKQLDSEISKAISDVTGGVKPMHVLDGFKYLNGSAANTPSPEMFLGPADGYIPKSQPIYPYSAPPSSQRMPGMEIFTAPLTGDSLSERVGVAAANVRKSSIPVPPAFNYISTTQSYSDGMEHAVLRAPTVIPPESLKRKAADEPTHSNRFIEKQVPWNYDPAFTPGIPSSVNAATSVEWREYSGENRGFNVPLTDAPNIVGIGFDAETTERQMNMSSSDSGGMEHTMDGDKTDKSPPVNPANQTNPIYKNTEKAKPEESKEKPVASYHVRD